MLLLVLPRRAELLNDPDTYMHLAAGRWIMAHGMLPVADPFSFSLAGQHWVAHEYLAEIIFAAADNWAGWAGVALLTALLFALAMGLLTRGILGGFEPLTGLIVTVYSAILLEPHLLARAHALALPLMVLWSSRIIAARDRGEAPPWWLLPVMVLWANLHGSALAGLALAGFLGAEAVILGGGLLAARRWGVFLALSIVAALITPNGIEGFLLPLRLSSMPVLQATFIEWQSPNFQHLQTLDLWIVAALMGLAGGFRLPPLRLAVVTALLLNAMAHQRHTDLLAVMAPLLLAGSLGRDLGARVAGERPSPVARLMAALAPTASLPGTALVIAIMAAIGAASLAIPLARPDDPITPGAALAAARAAGVTGNVLNDEGFGGYLILQGVPVFIDGRMELYGDDFLSRYLAAESGKQPALDDLLSEYKIGWAILEPGSGAALALERIPGWRRIYSDKFAVVEKLQSN
jgi:hypothetical protein